MKKDYATIAASTIAALLLAVSPAAAGEGKKAGGSVSTESSTSVTTETTTEPSVSGGVSTGGAIIPDSPSASPKMGDDKDKFDAEKKPGVEGQEPKDAPAASPSTDEQKKDEGTGQEKK